MSCFFAPKPYALSAGEQEERAIADFVAFLTCPVWLPILGGFMGYSALQNYYNKTTHKRACIMVKRKLLAHTENVGIGDNFIYWKTKGIVYIVHFAYDRYTNIPIARLIQQNWTKGTGFVVTSLDSPNSLTADFIKDLEATCTETTCDNDMDVIVVRNGVFANIGNLVTPQNLADGYYGILANKFNIILLGI